jgi:hypothetical protein
MTLSQVIVTGVLAIFAGAGASLIQGWLNKPKTRAEAGQLHVAAEVSVSAESREWARDFAQRARNAEERAAHAEDRAEGRVDELEAGLIECYGYVRLLRDHYREHGETAPPLPVRLEALWRATGN